MKPKTLLFDVFGDVVDWRPELIRDLSMQSQRFPRTLDPTLAADAWQAEYQPAIAPIRDCLQPFTELDVFHRENLRKISADLQLDLSDQDDIDWLMHESHRLSAWPDNVPGINTVKVLAICASQSNRPIAMAVKLARYTYSWDASLGAEVVGINKPAPASHTRALDALSLAPKECMMVPAHNDDLAAAHKFSLQTAFICRPSEHGHTQAIDLAPEDHADFVAQDFHQLSAQLL